MKKSLKKCLAEIVFWLHVPIPILWVGLFLVPLSVWPDRIKFHFFYIASLTALMLVWGMILSPKTHKIRSICILTTLMQYLRGYKIEDKRNYDYSFLGEFFGRLKFKPGPMFVRIIIWISLLVASIQYFSLK